MSATNQDMPKIFFFLPHQQCGVCMCVLFCVTTVCLRKNLYYVLDVDWRDSGSSLHQCLTMNSVLKHLGRYKWPQLLSLRGEASCRSSLVLSK